jgi:hypothetical protein
MRRRARWSWGLILAMGLSGAQSRGEPANSEYQVKAAFIYKFATYIRWPGAAGADTSTPFVIGVLGKDPFGPSLDAVVLGRNVQGKGIVIRRLARLEEAIHCDVLFVSASERERLTQIFGFLRESPVLTVGDMDRFAELGGMINLVTTEDNQIRFDINKKAIDRARLHAPSQLLRLARIVDEAPPGGGGH